LGHGQLGRISEVVETLEEQAPPTSLDLSQRIASDTGTNRQRFMEQAMFQA